MRVIEQGLGYKPIEEVSDAFSTWTGRGVGLTKKSKETLPTVNVKLVNGVDVIVHSEQLFPTMQKRLDGEGYTKAIDLTGNHNVYLTEEVFEFDYIEKPEILSRISTQDLGVLIGIMYCAGVDNFIDLPKIRKEARKELERILQGVQFSQTEYYNRTTRYSYVINDREFLQAIEPFRVRGEIPEIFWNSKALWRGFLKSLFTFSIIGNEMMTVRANKDSNILKEVQKALMLFSINSSYSRGLKVSNISIFKNNCYRFVNNVTIFNPEIVFSGLDFKRFIKYKDKTMQDMRYLKVQSVKEIGETELFIFDGQIMTNGIICNK